MFDSLPHFYARPNEESKGTVGQQLELVDKLSITPIFKATVLKPYIAALYRSLTSRCRSKTRGVPPYVFIEAS